MRDESIINIRLRLPNPLHILLTEWAKKNQRSLNSEILFRLKTTNAQPFLEWEAERELRARAEEKVLREMCKDPRVQELINQSVEEARNEKNSG
jgi:Arc-like DNA binding domain